MCFTLKIKSPGVLKFTTYTLYLPTYQQRSFNERKLYGNYNCISYNYIGSVATIGIQRCSRTALSCTMANVDRMKNIKYHQTWKKKNTFPVQRTVFLAADKLVQRELRLG